MVRRRTILAVMTALVLTATAWATPGVGQAVPSFTVNDLTGTARTQRNLTGQYTVAFVMSDKDAGDAVSAWNRRMRAAAPNARIITLVALDLFPLLLTSTLVSRVQETTPRSRWTEVWFSRDGSLASSLGLPETETPWVWVVDPSGRVVESVHAEVSDAGVARVVAALRPRTQP
jgi:hypothetical protein